MGVYDNLRKYGSPIYYGYKDIKLIDIKRVFLKLSLYHLYKTI